MCVWIEWHPVISIRWMPSSTHLSGISAGSSGTNRGDDYEIFKMLTAITEILNQNTDTEVDVCMTSEMARKIELWTAMYENKAPWLDRKIVKSAQIPAAIASEVARLVTLEMKSEITGSAAAEYLNDQYQKKVLSGLRRYAEYGCAKRRADL